MNLNLSSTLLPGTPIGGVTLPKRKLFTWPTPHSLSLKLDWSSLESFLGCNRSAEYKLVQGRSAPPRTALIFGAAFHSALEVYYKSIPVPDDQRGKLLADCRTAIDLTFAEYPHTIIDDYRTSDYCFECFCKYVAEYRNERLTPLEHDGKRLVEFSFSLPIGEIFIDPSIFIKYGSGVLTDNPEREVSSQTNGPTMLPCSIEWTGIIDLVANFGDEIWVVDHKTTSILSGDFFDGFEIAMQPVGYVFAARQAFPDLDIKGFFLNTAACRKPTRTGTGFETFRRMYRYEQWHLDEWKHDALALIEEFVANLHSSFFPRKTQWCIGKYGKCPYFEVCSLKPEYRLEILNSGNFTDNTWKPVQ